MKRLIIDERYVCEVFVPDSVTEETAFDFLEENDYWPKKGPGELTDRFFSIPEDHE